MDPIAVLKYTLVFATMPIWLPFAKVLWEEFSKDMRPDGGLYGPIPTEAQRTEILYRISREFPSQVHEPKATYRKGAAAAIARHNEREEAKKKSKGGSANKDPQAGPQSGGSRRSFQRR